MHLTLSLTHDCNLACSYCYGGVKKSVFMSLETAQQAVTQVLALQPRSLIMGFFGGEPLLAWDILVAVTQWSMNVCMQSGVPLSLTLTTNGSLLTDDKLEFLRTMRFKLGVSLDGTKQMHDSCRKNRAGESSFCACIRGLDAALQILPDTEVIIVADPRQCHLMHEAVAFLVFEKKVRNITLNFNFYTTWDVSAVSRWQKALEQVGELYCKAYRNSIPLRINVIDNKITARIKGRLCRQDFCSFGSDEFAVAPSGNIYPCERLVGDESDQSLCIGTVSLGFFPDKRRVFSTCVKKRPQTCSRCAIRPFCQSRCGCINYAITGAVQEPGEIVCIHEQATLQIADRVGSTLYQEGNRLFISRFYA
ncbi:MAG: radical SAM protein [Chitinivibrionales bacterium]|nr:radical SAM protein [Chitinivibrionales bacterium]